MINSYLNSNIGYSRATGPSYGPVLNVSTCENLGYSSFSGATPTGFNAASDGSGNDAAGSADEITLVSGTQYFVEFDMVVNGGTHTPKYDLTRELNGASRTSDGAQSSSAGSNSFTFTCDESTTGVCQFKNADTETADFEITNLSVRAIL